MRKVLFAAFHYREDGKSTYALFCYFIDSSLHSTIAVSGLVYLLHEFKYSCMLWRFFYCIFTNFFLRLFKLVGHMKVL